MNIAWEFIIGALTLMLTFITTILAVSSHLGKRIDAGNKDTKTLIENLRQHTEKLFDITNQRITDAGKNTADLAQRMDGLAQRMDNRFAETNQRITGLSQRMDNHFDKTNQPITDAGKNTEKQQVESDTDKLVECDTDKLTERIQQHTAVLFEIVTQLVSSNSQNIDEINQRIRRLTNDALEVHATLFADGIIGEADTIQESEK